MTDLFLPANLVPSRMSWSIDDFTVADESAVTGATQTSELYGTRRWRCRLDFDLLDSRDGTLHAYDGFIAALRGRANRVWVPDAARRQRGTFPSPELLSNTQFDSTTGWTATAAALSAQNRSLRIKATRGYDGSSVPQAVGTSAAAVQYAPYAARALALQGRGSMGSNGVFLEAGGISGADYQAASGLRTRAAVLAATNPAMVLVAGNGSTGYTAGDYVDFPFASLARCALVDGSPNLLLHSNTGSQSAWNKSGCTSSSNGGRAPDGSVSGALDAQYILEDASTGSHFISQSVGSLPSAAEDYAFTVYARSGVRNWIWIQMLEATGSTGVYQYFNLSTGATGSNSTGANWANLRSYVADAGNGWYRITIVARKTNAATQVNVYIGAANADGSGTYTGGGGSTAHLLWWNAVFSATGVPARYATTTTTAAAAASQSGTGIYLKGLPSSTSGLLAAGDVVEIQGERKRVTASLDSDAAGLGHLQFEPPMRVSAADNAPVIIGAPLCRMRLAGNNLGTEYSPGIFGQGSIELVEA